MQYQQHLQVINSICEVTSNIFEVISRFKGTCGSIQFLLLSTFDVCSLLSTGDTGSTYHNCSVMINT